MVGLGARCRSLRVMGVSAQPNATFVAGEAIACNWDQVAKVRRLLSPLRPLPHHGIAIAPLRLRYATMFVDRHRTHRNRHQRRSAWHRGMRHRWWSDTGIHLGSKGETLAVGAGLTGQPYKENKATNTVGFGEPSPRGDT
jgi:hypothetical protein